VAGVILADAWPKLPVAGMILATMEVTWRPGPSGSL
jgi:hypothetical protein